MVKPAVPQGPSYSATSLDVTRVLCLQAHMHSTGLQHGCLLGEELSAPKGQPRPLATATSQQWCPGVLQGGGRPPLILHSSPSLRRGQAEDHPRPTKGWPLGGYVQNGLPGLLQPSSWSPGRLPHIFQEVSPVANLQKSSIRYLFRLRWGVFGDSYIHIAEVTCRKEIFRKQTFFQKYTSSLADNLATYFLKSNNLFLTKTALSGEQQKLFKSKAG